MQNKALKKYLSVGEVSKRSGLAISAIHFYESKGLIKSHRNGANHRRFRRDVLRRLAIIQAAGNLGIPLKVIAKAINTLPGDKIPTANDWQRLSKTWQHDLNERIKQLQSLRDRLDFCIGSGCLSLDKCQLFNPNDQLGENIAGAFLLST
ncbi:MAG: redox-sensitive transcriptional activator SoxR [Francisellaceae bacterium]